ncbi:MAG: hypothetical protein FJX76_03470 [Armatimonadetes bacterium]|nr:hypothetical protein [Armatimonadota bacterium]
MDPVRLSNNLLPPTLPVHPREAQPAVLEPAVIGDAVALGPIPTLPTETAPLPQPTVTVARTPQPAIPMTLTEGTQTPAGAAPYTYPSGPNGPRTPESRIVADRCREIAFSGRPLQDRAKEIGDILVEAVDGANSPNPAWEIATSEQVRLFVLETLEHTDAIRRLGELRGLDFHEHDFEGDTSKFNPEITRFLARPGRDDSVKWVINEHNAAPHHHLWKDPNANADDLREGATDVRPRVRSPARQRRSALRAAGSGRRHRPGGQGFHRSPARASRRPETLPRAGKTLAGRIVSRSGHQHHQRAAKIIVS